MARMNLEHVAEIERFRQQIEKVVAQSQRQVCMYVCTGTGLLIYSKSIQLIDNVLLLHIYNVIHQLCIIMYELYQELLMHIYTPPGSYPGGNSYKSKSRAGVP